MTLGVRNVFLERLFLVFLSIAFLQKLLAIGCFYIMQLRNLQKFTEGVSKYQRLVQRSNCTCVKLVHVTIKCQRPLGIAFSLVLINKVSCAKLPTIKNKKSKVCQARREVLYSLWCSYALNDTT